jgi:hypothetical protein
MSFRSCCEAHGNRLVGQVAIWLCATASIGALVSADRFISFRALRSGSSRIVFSGSETLQRLLRLGAPQRAGWKYSLFPRTPYSTKRGKKALRKSTPWATPLQNSSEDESSTVILSSSISQDLHPKTSPRGCFFVEVAHIAFCVSGAFNHSLLLPQLMKRSNILIPQYLKWDKPA